MSQLYTNVEKWLSQRPLWLQDAASRIIQTNSNLTAKDIQELVELCKSEAYVLTSNKKFSIIEPGSLSVKDSSVNLRLDSIDSVQGINALGPKKALAFNDSLSIVYGQNGSGKSSYVRLLKHISGTKKTGDLMGNVFDQNQQPQECSLTITANDNKEEIKWTPKLGPLKKVSTLQLYDTDCANIYVNDENEVAYEPWILQFLSHLTNVSVRVGDAIKQEMESITATKLVPNGGSAETKSISWLDNISSSTSDKEINFYCKWDQADETQLNNKRQQFAEIDPAEKVKVIKKKMQNTRSFYSLLTNIKNSLSEELCTRIIIAKSDYQEKKRVAEEDAQKVFDGLSIEGVGTESWKLLWEQARLFSEQHAFPNETFPYTATDSVCVLCHQSLTDEAEIRLNSFELHIKDSLNKQAEAAKEYLRSLFESIKTIPDEATLELYFNSIGITSDEEKERIKSFCNTLQKRNELLAEATSLHQISPLPLEEVLIGLDKRMKSNEEQLSVYEKLLAMESRNDMRGEILELEARKWLHQNIAIIYENVSKFKLKEKYKKAHSMTNTKWITIKKSSLSDQLITSDYIKRFNKELKELGGSRINVSLVKTKAKRGQVYHQIKLKNCPPNVRTSEVLSEGEFRIVSLAGFLADVEGRSGNTPFIFDDPISSLDQSFEESTIRRIAKLSLTRQVIVFTHRLSFLTLLEEAASKLAIDSNVTWLRAESWGKGEPGETPVFVKKPDKALNQLLDERLSRARKTLENEGRTEYDLLAKGICSDFRILIERFIENDLLADIVQRFRRSVTTMGKIHKLAHINVDDCIMFEELMTKYSTYEHSQSYETPVMLPEPDELREDMEKIKEWVKEFKKRNTA